MKTVRSLHRDTKTPDAIFGTLAGGNDGSLVIQTLEDPEDFIAPGEYVCVRDWYHRGDYETFEVTGVEDRTRILFHIGNTKEDTEGCVLLGRHRGVLDGVDAVLASALAFEDFMKSLDGVDEFTLVITESYED